MKYKDIQENKGTKSNDIQKVFPVCNKESKTETMAF